MHTQTQNKPNASTLTVAGNKTSKKKNSLYTAKLLLLVCLFIQITFSSCWAVTAQTVLNLDSLAKEQIIALDDSLISQYKNMIKSQDELIANMQTTTYNLFIFNVIFALVILVIFLGLSFNWWENIFNNE